MRDAAERPPAGQGRRDTIDFWRGFILCTIFVNHVPGNLFERLTFRNFGFCDSSEAFVFISGLSLALAYGRRFALEGGSAVAGRLAQRAVKLYAFHIGLSLAGIAIFAAGAALTQNPDLMQVHGRDLVVDDPLAALLGLFSLGHQFGYFNILPLYVLLVGFAPLLFVLARVSRPLMLAVSFGVYALTRLSGLNVPSWPMRGTWFFDPFAWQVLMAAGLAVGLQLRAGIRLNRWLVGGALAVLVGAAFCATDGLSTWPGLNDAVRPLLDLDKTTLGLGRIAHFLSLACVLHAAGVAKAMRLALWYKPLCLVGQNGLLMFGLLSLMAALGQVVTETLGHTPLVDATVIVGGLAVLCAAAGLLERRREGLVPAHVGMAAEG
jgi:hypothetical protein